MKKRVTRRYGRRRSFKGEERAQQLALDLDAAVGAVGQSKGFSELKRIARELRSAGQPKFGAQVGKELRSIDSTLDNLDRIFNNLADYLGI